MSGFFEKLKLDKESYKRIVAIIIVAAGGAIIYGLPYFRYDYYDVYLEFYNLTNTQMGTFGSILGIFGMISYLFGGVVADRFKTRTILTVSLIATGVGGFIHLLPLSYGALLVLYAYWGVTSLFAFWPACIKAVRILADSDSQGKGYGIFESGRGVFAALMATFAVVAFRIGAGNMGDQVKGMRYTIIFYSILTIGTGIITYFAVKEDDGEVESEKMSFKGIGEVLKMPAVWIISFVVFSNYFYTQLSYYFTPYSTEFFGASVTFAASLAASKRWFSILGSLGGGYIADRVGTSKIMSISFLAMTLFIGAMLMLPLNSGSLIPYVVLFLVVYVFYNVNSTVPWAMMEEGSIPAKYSGTAAGVISTVGYLPEIFAPAIAGNLLDQNPGIIGYRKLFGFLMIMLAIGFVFAFIWGKYLNKQKALGAK